MPFQIIRNDITKVHADAIVNTANRKPIFGRGTDRAVYLAAGEEELLQERRKIGEIAVGEAAATRAFSLKAKYIIHTAGPKWKGGREGELQKLAACYRKSLRLAQQLGCKSIAFPLISAGNFGFPKEEALDTALREIRAFLTDEEMDVTLVVFDRAAFELSKELTDKVAAYIDEKYVDEKREEEYAGFARREEQPQAEPENLPFEEKKQEVWKEEFLPDSPEDFSYVGNSQVFSESSVYDTGVLPELSEAEDTVSKPEAPGSGPESVKKQEMYQAPCASPMPDAAPKASAYAESAYAKSAKSRGRGKDRHLSDLLSRTQDSFQESLLHLIDERGYTDVEIYKKANIDRKLFSKIRSNPAYQPKKRTAIALAMALELNMDETIDLIGRAGLAFSPASKADLIIEYCIENGIYDLYTVNSILFDYDQPLLGV